MQALLAAHAAGKLPVEPVVVFSNRADAAGLEDAAAAGLPTLVPPPHGRHDRAAHDAELIERLRPFRPDGAVLAGYMRIVTPTFLEAFPAGVLNIHPSLLPAFPGVDAVRQAWDWGVKVVGCTVHFVDAEVDHGPIILQRTLPVGDAADAAELAARLLVEEHLAIVDAVTQWGAGKLQVQGRRVVASPA